MQLIPILLVVDAMVSGSLMMGNEMVTGGSVTLHNAATMMKADVNSEGMYSLSVPSGTYDVTVQRTVAGRKRTLVFNGLTLGDGNMTVNLWWPTENDTEKRQNLITQHYSAGRAADAAGNYSQAASEYRMALREDCSQHAIWSALATALAHSSSSDADAAFKTARAWGAGSATASNIATVYYRGGRFGEAGAMYKTAAEMDASKAGTYLANAGAAYYSGRMMAEAEAAYKMASEVPGAMSSSWYFWGVCAQSNGNRDAALAGLRGYLRADANGRFAADARQRISSLGG